MTNKTPANLWKPGQSGNPAGRPPGQSVITRLRAQIEPDAPAILQVMVAAAKGGDIQAARLILERIIPPIKPTEQAIELPLMGDSLAEMGRAVLAGISVGEVAPAQGSQLIASIGALSRLIQIDELERRITLLETRRLT